MLFITAYKVAQRYMLSEPPDVLKRCVSVGGERIVGGVIQIVEKKFKVNREEYLLLRNEIMTRAGYHQEYTKNATTTSVSIWVGSFALLTFFYSQDFFNMLIFVLLFPILIMLPLSFKVYENYTNICNIFTYLIKFHERPINENDGTFFSWETSLADLRNNFIPKKSTVTKILSRSNSELTFLSCISLCLFIAFSCVGLKNNFSIHFLIINIVTTILGILVIIVINKHSSYKCIGEISMDAKKFWDSYQL